MTSAETLRLERLFDDYGQRIYAFCLRLCGDPTLAEDLAAEVFLDAPRSLDRFRGEASEQTLLYKIALNKHRMARRSHAQFLRWAALSFRQDRQDSPESSIVFEAAFAREMDRLSPKIKEAFLLVKAEKLSYAEAAAAMDVPVGTVRSRVHEACKRLSERLDSPTSIPLTEATHEV